MSDLISKKRLKWEIEKWYEKEYYSSFNAAVYKTLIKIIDKSPSVEPERPHGKWIMRSGGRQGTHAECSNCGMKNYAGILNYCPDCGAEMKGEHT